MATQRQDQHDRVLRHPDERCVGQVDHRDRQALGRGSLAGVQASNETQTTARSLDHRRADVHIFGENCYHTTRYISQRPPEREPAADGLNLFCVDTNVRNKNLHSSLIIYLCLCVEAV